eukprot:jgi/Orpsp1_1/1174776/evm.model.c7180000051383.1
MNIIKFIFFTLNNFSICFIKTYLIISLITINPFKINESSIVNVNNKNSINLKNEKNFGIPFVKAYYTNTYFDFNYYDRILSIGDFRFEKGGEVTVKLSQVILQYNGRRFRTYSNYTFFNDLYIGVCNTEKWLDFMKENDNSNNNPYYKNITDYNNNTVTDETDNNIKKRMIEEIIIEDIKDSEYFSDNRIVSVKKIDNITESLKIFDKNNTSEKTKLKIGELLTGIYFLPENNYENKIELEDINDSDIITNFHRNDNENNDYNNDNNNSTDSNENNYIIIDRFYDLLTEANICVNLTDFYSMSSDLENYRFHTEIPNEGHYSVFMLKTRSLVLMGFDGEISVTFKNPYKYPHFSTDQYNIIKMHSLFLGIWMILLLLWLCAWINKIKIELPLVKLIAWFPLMNVIILGLETYKYHYYGKNGEYSILVILLLALLLMLRTTYIYGGMLYFSKGMFIIRKMMIPDETRSIL